MHVTIATLCDAVRTRDDGRVDVLGVAPDQVVVQGFPWQGRLTFALVLELSDDDDRTQRGMNVSVIRARDGAVVGQVGSDAAVQSREVPEGDVGPVHLAFELGLDCSIAEPGIYRVLVRTPEDRRLAEVGFSVVEKS